MYISAAILSYAVCSVGANANVLGFAFMTEAQLAEKTGARQLYLDARTKIILCLTVSFLMFFCEYTGVMRFVLPVLAAVPFVSFLILRRYRKAAVYGMVYVLCLMLPMLLRQLDAPVFSIISGALAAIFTQMLPGLAMFDVLLSSTTVSEFIGAMDGFHISKKFSVPVSVMFRFFPTIREEYGMIRDAAAGGRRLGASVGDAGIPDGAAADGADAGGQRTVRLGHDARAGHTGQTQ